MSSKAKITKGDASEDALPTLKAPYLVRTIPQMPVKAAEMNKKRRWLFQKKTEVVEDD